MNRWKSWGELPEFMKNEYTLRYYRRLSRKRGSMALKRIFDVIMSLILLVPLSPVILVLAIWIKADSKGPVFSDRNVSPSMAENSKYINSEQW